MVSKNYGVCITTMRSAKKCNLSDVTFLKIKNPAEKRKLGLVWRRNNKAISSPMKKFYDVVTKFYNIDNKDL